MAPIGERNGREGISADQNGEDEDKNLCSDIASYISFQNWATILGDVQSSSSTKLPGCKSVLVLGDNESGKTTLIAKMQGSEEPRKGAGLEYMHLDVKDDYRDDQTRLGVWICDGDLHYRGLLRFALDADCFAHSVVMLVASMAQPWRIVESLEKWAEVLRLHTAGLALAAARREEYRQSLVRQFQEYVEPVEDAPTSRTRAGASNPLHPHPGGGDEKVLLPLGDDTLTHNLGVPIIVVITKSDAISSLEKDHDYSEEHFDFVQQHIRKFCLSYGAALFYTSVKEEKNCDLLRRYLLHRIYGLPFGQKAFVMERDSVFVPSGWDSGKKISILYENMTSMSPDDEYGSVITKPTARKLIQRDMEVSSEEEQAFLMRIQTLLSKQPAAPTGGSPAQRDLTLRAAAAGPKGAAGVRMSGSPIGQPGLAATPKKGMDGGKPGAVGGEGVLANFFNSLLSKKTGTSPGATPKSADRAAVSRDAAVELDRMTRAMKPTPAKDSPS